MKRRTGKQLREVELRDLRRLTAGLVNHRAPALSRDGRWICMQAGEGEQAFWLICDWKGRPARVLEGPADGGAAFAPDNSLVYGRRVGATLELWRLDSGATEPRMLLGGDGRLYRDPAYSHDGRRLCYAADDPTGKDGGITRLWTQDVEEGAYSPVGGVPEARDSYVGRPAFAPVGEQLYFEASSEASRAVYLLDLTSGESRLLLENSRRPAPIGGDLLVVEREHSDGTSELVLLDHAGDDPPRERVLTTPAQCAREAAVVVRKGGLYLSCAMLPEQAHGEPQRYDLFTARLQGVGR